jgi:hypothetical protein
MENPNEILNDIIELVQSNPNDQDLGKKLEP